jgi:hypothetical protein
MTSRRVASASAMIQLDARRVLRDPKLLVLFGAVLASSLFGPEVRELVANLSLLFLPVAVGWSWGSDLETGALVPLAIAANGRLRFFVSRFLVLTAFSFLALTPSLLDRGTGEFPRTLLIGGVVAALLFGFLLVTGLRTSHAGWIPLFLAIAAVLGWLQVIREKPSGRPPLWLWLLASGVLPTWAVGLAPERKLDIPWVLLVSSALFAAATASILRWRTTALGRRV